VHVDTTDTHELQRFYTSHVATLTTIAESEFQIPSLDAEDLAHGVLLSALRHLPRGIDLPVWLRGAITAAASRYRSEHG
jgi:hypothetical protein